MTNTEIFTLALGVIDPWKITDTQMLPSPDKKGKLELHIYIDFLPGTSFKCPVCGKECKAYDTKERVWRHMNFFQYKCYIHARVPRITCPDNGIKTVDVPWGREGSGFTLLMEGVILNLIRHMPVAAVAKEIDEHDTKLWRIINHYVEEEIAKRDFSDVSEIGVDEYSHKGYDFITLFMTSSTWKHHTGRVMHIEHGKGKSTVEAFEKAFKSFKGIKNKITDITSDMCHGYRNAMQKLFPDALLTVDKFHVLSQSADMVDKVRKFEMHSKDVSKTSALSGAKYVFLKNPENLTAKQATKLEELKGLSNLDTLIAYDYHMRLKAIYDKCTDYEDAAFWLEHLVYEMAGSNINAIRKQGKSLARNAIEILNYFVHRKTNAILEGFNSKISIIKNRARGFRTMKNFMNMIYFCLGDFEFPLVHLN